ncbi:MAG TPA: neutral zinc metallopeptidase [Acidimicrobiales bacterium]|nr:neutral zinc metallopeptidase [Acidimicrobiales bacterium]
MVQRLWTTVLACGLAPALAAGCAQAADDDLVISQVPIEDDSGQSGPQPSDDPSATADLAVEDVTGFWRETFPQLYGEEFVDLAGFFPYGPDSEPPPCGSPPPSYDVIAENAFYCPEDDIIAWDEVNLLPPLNETFGSFTVAIVIAHEFGHAIQARANAFDRTVDLELQADCFAGAWTADVAEGGAASFSRDDIDLDQTVAGMLAIRDLPGTDPDDPAAHGSGFDRVSAFQDGFENSAEACVGYADESVDRATAEIEFTEGDFETEGNLHLEDLPDEEGLLTLVERDLNEFYADVFDELGETWTPVDDLVLADPDEGVTCGGETLSGSDLESAAYFCEDENIVVLDGSVLVPDLNEIGDFAVAAEIARLWTLDAQNQLGVLDGEDAELQADCLVGVWSFSVFPDSGVGRDNIQMSAGDLDEAIMGFVKFSSESGSDGDDVFARARALRTGFFDGYNGCKEYGPLG